MCCADRCVESLYVLHVCICYVFASDRLCLYIKKLLKTHPVVNQSLPCVLQFLDEPTETKRSTNQHSDLRYVLYIRVIGNMPVG